MESDFLEKRKTYKCIYVSGGGTEHEEGIWRVRTLTEKTLVVEKIDEEDGLYYNKGDLIKCGRMAQNGNTLKEWSDGTFTIYPDQGGTPFVFSPATWTCGLTKSS